MINDTVKSDQTYSVSQFIDMKSSDEVTYHNYAILEYSNGIEFAVTNILYDYEDELIDSSSFVKLNDKEFAKYKYKPWLLAYDLYGSVEATFVIHILNGILSDREFDFKKVRIIHPDILSDILGRIYSANYRYINNNRSDLLKAEKDDMTQLSVW